jgi:hypothetical protein
MPLIPTKLLALAPVILISSAASASPAARVVHEATHTHTRAASSEAPAPRPTTPMLADDGCPLPGNVGKGESAHDRCERRRAEAKEKAEVAHK